MDKGYAHATWLVYKTLDWFLMWNHEYVSKHFNARTGFVPRIDNYNPQTNKIVKNFTVKGGRKRKASKTIKNTIKKHVSNKRNTKRKNKHHKKQTYKR
jgi:hypothetical protein